MKTIEVTLYKFDELPEDVQEKALEQYADFNVEHVGWWDSIYEDARAIGLEISEFDTYRRSISGAFVEAIEDVISLIKENHGETCDTYLTACNYEKGVAEALAVEDEDNREALLEDIAFEFLNDLLSDYLKLLGQEYEWLTSPENIAESLRINDYDFTIDGKIYY